MNEYNNEYCYRRKPSENKSGYTKVETDVAAEAKIINSAKNWNVICATIVNRSDKVDVAKYAAADAKNAQDIASKLKSTDNDDTDVNVENQLDQEVDQDAESSVININANQIFTDTTDIHVDIQA